MMALVSFALDIGWGYFAKTTLQRAVRVGVTSGTRLAASQLATGACLTDTVKSVAQLTGQSRETGAHFCQLDLAFI
jgi:hypothetical protein